MARLFQTDCNKCRENFGTCDKGDCFDHQVPNFKVSEDKTRVSWVENLDQVGLDVDELKALASALGFDLKPKPKSF